ncbi:MAG: RNA polymerase sigma factor [Planctomycetes bacterium]|nr:RNA polymerase sigma factor [Planctomycetota bacterium]
MNTDFRTLSEIALRDRILAGDQDAARWLFEEHFDALYEFAHYRLGGERAQAEDVVQDTFVVALESLSSFDGRSSLHTWLCGIAKNKVRALRRKRRPAPLADVLDEADDEIDAVLARVSSEPLPDWALERKETRELVGATLSSLPPDYRRALVAKYVSGRSVAQIAQDVGRSEKAAESLLTRARAAFGEVFELLARKRGGEA